MRFLPAFDNAILGYDDRSRIIDDAHRGLSVAGERVVLVDGRAAATWSVDSGTVTVSPTMRLLPSGSGRRDRAGAGPGVLPLRQRERPGAGRFVAAVTDQDGPTPGRPK
ncbi:DNA glycosylase AlkZ-like family protein [Micromonospora sp. DT228]|uniref:DNA glycosylase AlkZ-like family protein n=1 Tax=Micromonospora sp. DT228 TaxID=3393443 RepID=UPI003CF2E9F3